METMSCGAITRKLKVHLPSILDFDFESQFRVLVKAVDFYVAAHPGCRHTRPSVVDKW